MSWSGIYLVHVPEGVSPRAAVDETIAGWFANPVAPGSHLAAVPPHVEIEHDPTWPSRAVTALQEVNPELRRVDDGGFDDGVGPGVIYVYGTEAQLMPKKDGEEPNDLDGFAIMWSYCKALADTGCVAHDPDDDEIIDLSLELWEARRWYNWL